MSQNETNSPRSPQTPADGRVTEHWARQDSNLRRHKPSDLQSGSRNDANQLGDKDLGEVEKRPVHAGAARKTRQPTAPLFTTPEIETLLAGGSPVAIGVSGGKDSSAVAAATCEFLDQFGHGGPRVLIHSDLGSVEWKESLPTCQRLADHLGLRLIVVKRAAGGLMERWRSRWEANVQRYANLECVKLILPWSTPSMRFCTAELKRDVICRQLVREFPGKRIISVSGIRRQESPARSKSPVTSEQIKLANRTHNTSGLDWNPILAWTLDDVLGYLERRGIALHEAYTSYGSSRVSCVFCILGSKSDLAAAARCADNAGIYREMVALELESTFSFQDAGWLADVAPHLLSEGARDSISESKRRAAIRERIESRIPKHLLYTKGWPTCLPTPGEAELLAEVRCGVAEAVGLTVSYRSAASIRDRYQQLMSAKLEVAA